MQKQCLKCSAIADVGEDPLAECPKCGAIYARVEEAEQRKAQAAEAQIAAKKAEEKRQAALEAERALYAARGAEALAKRQQGDPTKGFLCGRCGQADAAKNQARGSLLGEIALWLVAIITIPFGIGVLLLIVAIVFSIWRMFSRRRVCRSCGAEDLVPANSPRGRELAAQFHSGAAPENKPCY